MLSLNHPSILTLCGAPRPRRVLPTLPYQENGSVSRLVHEQRWAPTWGAALILERSPPPSRTSTRAASSTGTSNHERAHRRRLGRQARRFGLAEDETALRRVPGVIYQTRGCGGQAVAGRYVGTCRQGTAAAPSGGFQKQHMVGTLAYMAPEMPVRRVPGPADVSRLRDYAVRRFAPGWRLTRTGRETSRSRTRSWI